MCVASGAGLHEELVQQAACGLRGRGVREQLEQLEAGRAGQHVRLPDGRLVPQDSAGACGVAPAAEVAQQPVCALPRELRHLHDQVDGCNGGLCVPRAAQVEEQLDCVEECLVILGGCGRH